MALWSRALIALAGAPTISELSGNTLPSVTSALAPTRQLAPTRVIEHGRSHPDQGVVADRAAMQDRVVAYGASGPDAERRPTVRVEKRRFLDIGRLADVDQLVVAAKDRSEPDTHIAP